MDIKGNLYHDIAERTDGNIYLGIVGPVRTGKSTFIKRFMDTLVIPNIEGDFRRERANDELPQSAAGRTIMTTEPKFVPEEAVKLSLDQGAELSVRLVDCVGYIVPSALGYIENDQPRMVKTPWFDEEIPFNMAAEMGTKKVISEHSTIGLVITTDGSISDIPRDEYEEAEERVIRELQEIDKPFVVLLNCVNPGSQKAVELAKRLTEKYVVPVLPVNCMELTEKEINEILRTVLWEFPVQEIQLFLPRWIVGLPSDHWLRKELCEQTLAAASRVTCVRELSGFSDSLCTENSRIKSMQTRNVALGTGSAVMDAEVDNGLFYQILAEITGLSITDESELISNLVSLAEINKKYEKVRYALEEVEATGYGIVMPSVDELTLEQPEIMRQGSQYGVSLRAAAPSIHMMKCSIQTEISPVVGSERQSEELVHYLLDGFEDSPESIWDSNIFGKSLHDLVNEGLHTKLSKMPPDARKKLQETLERVINDGCSGLICIIL